MLTAVAAAYAVQSWQGTGSRRAYAEPAWPVDARPARTILFLGNSRIYAHDMPRIVREIAESAGSPVRYDVQMRAWGGATLKEHWEDDGDQELLKKPWDDVILQTQSATFMSSWSESEFRDYGARLAQTAKTGGARVAILANWPLGPAYFDTVFHSSYTESIEKAKRYGEHAAEATRAFGAATGAGVIDIAGAFAEAQRLAPRYALTEDGNHPSSAGSYLAALVVYSYLSHDDLSRIEWRPSDMDRETAALFRAIAARHAS